MRVAIGLQREAPHGVVEEANRLLHDLAPRSDVSHWLHAYYEPGEPWAPVERIIVAEMIPKAELGRQRAFFRLIDSQELTLFDELEGPNPRTGAWYGQRHETLAPTMHYPGLPPSISLRQWEHWRAFGALSHPTWVVQGENGGHMRKYPDYVKSALALRGLPSDEPLAGDLGFARLDQRTMQHLRDADRLAKWTEKFSGVDWDDRTNVDALRERKAKEVEFRRDFMKWLDDAIVPVAVEMSRMIDFSNLPEGDRRYNEDEDEVERRLLEDTDTVLPEEQERTYGKPM